MAYATQDHLKERYGERELIQVTDKAEPPVGVVDTTVVARALADADAEIDSRISVRYAVPVSPTPAAVLDAACRIARYKLHEDRAPEKVRNDYKDAIAWLDAVAAGRANLPGAALAETSASDDEGADVGGFSVRAPDPVFTEALTRTMP